MDNDLQHVLSSIRGLQKHIRERVRVSKVRDRHAEQAIDRIQTHVELLTDELVEVGIARDSPLFLPVIAMVLQRKIQAYQEQIEPEFESELEKGFPPGW